MHNMHRENEKVLVISSLREYKPAENNKLICNIIITALRLVLLFFILNSCESFVKASII